MDRILLTGGAGYIGTILAEHLLQSGHEVRILDRFFFGTDLLDPLRHHSGLSLIKADTRSAPAEAFDGVETVMHLADISNDPSADLDRSVTEDINLRGTVSVARVAKARGVRRFIFSSSCSVYGSGGDEVITESSPTRPVSLYADMKVRAEERLLQLASDAFSVTILRNATAYGLSYRMRFDLVINLMTWYAFKMRKIFIMGGGKQWRPLIHVRDLADVFRAVAAAPRSTVASQTFNVGSDEQNYQVQALANLVRELVPDTEIQVAPDDPDKRSYHVSFAKLRSALDFRPQRDVRDGVTEVWDALRAGTIEDGPRTRTVEYYRYLLEAARVVKDVSIDGRIF